MSAEIDGEDGEEPEAECAAARVELSVGNENDLERAWMEAHDANSRMRARHGAGLGRSSDESRSIPFSRIRSRSMSPPPYEEERDEWNRTIVKQSSVDFHAAEAAANASVAARFRERHAGAGRAHAASPSLGRKIVLLSAGIVPAQSEADGGDEGGRARARARIRMFKRREQEKREASPAHDAPQPRRSMPPPQQQQAPRRSPP